MTIQEFLQGSQMSVTQHYHYGSDPGRDIYTYLRRIYDVLQPTGTVLNMGVLKRTPKSIKPLLDDHAVTRVRHIELDVCEVPPRLTEREELVAGTDFVAYLMTQPDYSWDGVLMWNGPEHLARNRAIMALSMVAHVTRDWVVVACPWGRFKPGVDGRCERKDLGHKSEWKPEDLQVRGFRTLALGVKDVYPSCMIGWWRRAWEETP